MGFEIVARLLLLRPQPNCIPAWKSLQENVFFKCAPRINQCIFGGPQQRRIRIIHLQHPLKQNIIKSLLFADQWRSGSQPLGFLVGQIFQVSSQGERRIEWHADSFGGFSPSQLLEGLLEIFRFSSHVLLVREYFPIDGDKWFWSLRLTWAPPKFPTNVFLIFSGSQKGWQDSINNYTVRFCIICRITYLINQRHKWRELKECHWMVGRRRQN